MAVCSNCGFRAEKASLCYKLEVFTEANNNYLKITMEENYVLVASIDFGTSYSGWGYSFVSDKKNKKQHEDISLFEWPIMGHKVSQANSNTNDR